MKSSPSNISNIHWSSKIEDLYPKDPTKSAKALIGAGYTTLESLLWLIPLRVFPIPVIKNFTEAYEDCFFSGVGKVLSTRSLPSFKGRGKGHAQLLNLSVIVQDIFSSKILEIKWFNAYSSVAEKFQKASFIKFTGNVQIYQEKLQIVNPEFHEINELDLPKQEEVLSLLPNLKIQYPTVNGVNTSNIKKIIDKIPMSLWENIEDVIPKEVLEKRQYIGLRESFLAIHGKREFLESWNIELYERARDRLIYQELFEEQIKVHLRKKMIRDKDGVIINSPLELRERVLKLFPYQLTEDQTKVNDEILEDLKSHHPMMRLVQGDVGCGKTSVAISTGAITCLNGFQTALMCPTESLAYQHFNEIKTYCKELDISIALLLGSTTTKEKKEILHGLASGKIKFIIGTHSLFQDSVQFKNLALAIIDEQHKFGVEQRLKLVAKGVGCHCLIMTATPIPRSLSLTQYGDLNISTINSMPKGRKGSKTRIVDPTNFGKFLNFVNTRINMDEQVYIVVPAITESPNQDILNLNDVRKRFEHFFPNKIIAGMHGQMKTEEKSDIFAKFNANKINILVATSVIEVGINVINATVVAIMNPERFGLSSLHQLRGRVGRGEKPGFCFLITEKNLSGESMNRLKVIENHNDGFHIAEEDLKIRGAGDLFGKDQSGSINTKRIANIILNSKELELAQEDVSNLIEQGNAKISNLVKKLAKDAKIFSTV
ncbi:hypothetical protein A9Q84_21555 [Halobacteriovorax marinus]|uniref:ATP-dependent DNA helicase RecG n=1 Tax=Halobacteriovorax marinus TaxID=97084 RepID=A0A1Y5F882_9BACT|nr:hypothetical protein A9Q84_21555 [Halobacteriovorax marinus]